MRADAAGYRTVTCPVCTATFRSGDGHVCDGDNGPTVAIFVRTRQDPEKRAAAKAAMHAEPGDFVECKACEAMLPPADIEDHPCSGAVYPAVHLGWSPRRGEGVVEVAEVAPGGSCEFSTAAKHLRLVGW